jgi:spore coat protein A
MAWPFFFRSRDAKVSLSHPERIEPRIYKLALSNGQPLIQIGTDGGLLQRPLERASIEIAPSERIDVVVDSAA